MARKHKTHFSSRKPSCSLLKSELVVLHHFLTAGGPAHIRGQLVDNPRGDSCNDNDTRRLLVWCVSAVVSVIQMLFFSG